VVRDSNFVECVFEEFGEKVVEILGKAVVEAGGDDGLFGGGVVGSAVVGDGAGFTAVGGLIRVRMQPTVSSSWSVHDRKSVIGSISR